MKNLLRGVLLVLVCSVFMVVNAADWTQKLFLDQDNKTVTDLGDGKSLYTYNIYVLNEGYAEGTQNDGEVKVDFEFGNAIVDYKCGDAGEYIGSPSEATDNHVVCTFAQTGSSNVTDKVLVGKLEVTVQKTADNKDCTIMYKFKESSGKVNPDTGVSLPVMVIGTCAVLAVGAFVVTSKKTKFSKI